MVPAIHSVSLASRDSKLSANDDGPTSGNPVSVHFCVYVFSTLSSKVYTIYNEQWKYFQNSSSFISEIDECQSSHYSGILNHFTCDSKAGYIEKSAKRVCVFRHCFHVIFLESLNCKSSCRMFIDKFRFKILTSVPVRHVNMEPVGILSMGMPGYTGMLCEKGTPIPVQGTIYN